MHHLRKRNRIEGGAKLATSHFIGIDIGATRIKMGVVTHAGRLIYKDHVETAGIIGPSQFVKTTKDAVEGLIAGSSLERQSIGAIGFGAPGWVDHQKGIVHELTNITDWEDFPLAREIETAVGLESFVDNDANAMAVGEMIHGAGRGRRNFVCLTLGTGVGGAIVIDGAVYRGVRGLAGEIGHLTLDLDGPTCACGAAGCLEKFVGNRFLVGRAVELAWGQIDDGRGKILVEMADNRAENVTAKMLSEAAEKGDTVALEVWKEAGRRLGASLAGLVNLLNPECFIIGGGVAEAGDVLFVPMREEMESIAMNKLGYSTPLMRAELGEDAGLIGAATFARICSEQGTTRPPGS
jgi:glucokinase